MRFKSRYFILFKDNMNETICWPLGWGNTCRANLVPMLKQVLKKERICSEIKLIFNFEHEMIILKNNNITSKELQDYLAAKTSSLHFHSKKTRDKAIRELYKMGAYELVPVDDYRDLILYQAYFYIHGEFPSNKIK